MSGKGGKKGGNQGGNNKKEGGDKNDFKFDFGGNGGKPVLTKEATAALMPVLQQKLGNLVGKSSGYLETLPQSVQKRITALKSIQKKHDDLEAEFKKEREALEKKYDALKNPLYLRRSEIVKGESEPTEQELIVEKKEGEEEAPKTEAKIDNTVVKGIPEFWAGVLKHNEDFNQMIEPEDEPALKHLIDIKCSPISADDTSPSFTLEFYFSPNEYFEETLLKKTYHLNEDPVYGDVMFDHVETTEINWKAGKNLTVKKVTKKDNGGGRGGKGKKGGRAGPPKMIQVEEPCNSFFRFFSLIPEEAEVEDEDELQDLLESDYELGLIVKSQIIPNAVMWFTGEMELGMDGFDEEDDEEGDDEDDDEGEGEDDDEDDDEEFDPSTAPTTGQQGQQPECKQQ